MVTAERVTESKEYLSRHLSPGDNLWFLSKGFTNTGRRYYDVYMVAKDKEIRRITFSVHELTDYGYDRKREALYVDGTGFNAMFDVAEALSLALFGNGTSLNYRDL